MRVIGGVVPHRTVIHSTFPLSPLQETASTHRRRRSTVTAPHQQAVAVPVAPRLTFAPIVEPPLVILLEPGIGPFEQLTVVPPLIDFPNSESTNRRVGPIHCSGGS